MKLGLCVRSGGPESDVEGMTFQTDAHPTAIPVPDALPLSRPHDVALLSVRDVCVALQCGRTFVYELLRRGDLRPIKLGRLTRISRNELNAFLRGKEAAAADGLENMVDTKRADTRFIPSVAAHHRSDQATRVARAPAVEQPYLLDTDVSTSPRR